jgi:transcriptional regulator with XRE-family HTH domain
VKVCEGKTAPETLADFVRRTRKEKNLSLSDISKQSARFGTFIAASYVCRIENEPTRRITANSLAALANGLGVPVQELLARATGAVPAGNASEEFELLTRFRSLSRERKADVLKIVNMWYTERL